LQTATQLLGQTIDGGALRIDSILGAGSFGTVYHAVDNHTLWCANRHRAVVPVVVYEVVTPVDPDAYYPVCPEELIMDCQRTSNTT
jgi:hypothetical protein